ncbi:MAG: DUF2730 family protein [Thermomonas sp.]|nr:DUF2730 family protein [Thermomonas sp.]
MKGCSNVPGTINEWLAAAALIFSLLNTLWMWISRPARDVGDRLQTLKSEGDLRWTQTMDNLKEHDRRIQRVEDGVQHLPTKDDLHEVADQVTRLGTELEGISRVVTRIDDFLRQGGKR